MIRLQQLAKSYDAGATYAVEALDLDIRQGELLVLLGESGCGKTTTLKMINRLIEPTAGAIEIDGEDARGVDPVQLRRRIGYVFQGVGLFPHMTVAENVAVVPHLLGWDRTEINRRVDELLDMVALSPTEYRDRPPAALSGGQRQRVGLARAMAARPKIMLMDEPLGALDPLTRDSLQDEFQRIHKQHGLTTVMVTHDMTEALLMADRIAVMNGGRIVRLGPPSELLHDPRDEYVKRLMDTPKRQADRLEELIGPDSGPTNRTARTGTAAAPGSTKPDSRAPNPPAQDGGKS